MTKRLYFTCPIKALYIMKEFGVKFECKSEETAIIDEIEQEDATIYDFADWGVDAESIADLLESFKNDYPKKIYVAAESEHIFELKENDYGGDFGFTGMSHVILLRDNKQFFMPKVENER